MKCKNRILTYIAPTKKINVRNTILNQQRLRRTYSTIVYDRRIRSLLIDLGDSQEFRTEIAYTYCTLTFDHNKMYVGEGEDRFSIMHKMHPVGALHLGTQQQSTRSPIGSTFSLKYLLYIWSIFVHIYIGIYIYKRAKKYLGSLPYRLHRSTYFVLDNLKQRNLFLFVYIYMYK
jgi:hypothetical protein